jgi:fermentation-respiration switch protein FrsA (DUF1100 family)
MGQFKKNKSAIFKLLFILIMATLISSCSMSSTFHHPSKMPKLENYSFSIKNDSFRIKYNRENHQVTFFDENNDTINKNYTIANEYFSSKNGNKLNGWMLTPKNVKPIASILQFHGSAGNLIFHHNIIAPLMKQGFQIFIFDYSGYGLSEGKATRKNVEIDAYSAFKHFIKKPNIKGTKLVLYGQSYGGYLAALVGTENQEKIDAIVIESGFTSHKAEAAYTVPIIGYMVKNGKTTTTKIIREYSKPLLIIHSIDDKRTPFRMGEKIYKNANEPKELFKIEKNHLEALEYYSEEIGIKIKNMLRE